MTSRGVAISGGNWFLADLTNPAPGNGFRVALGGELDPARTLEGVQLVIQVLSELSA